jgi:hypothetical protein
MNQRVKVFAHLTGHGATVIEPPLEDAINRWLEGTPGRLVRISQSESERPGVGHHVTVCIWYVPDEVEPDMEIPF